MSLDLTDNLGLIRAVADAITRNECRMYEDGHGHSGDECPAATAAVTAAAPLIEAQVREQIAADVKVVALAVITDMDLGGAEPAAHRLLRDFADGCGGPCLICGADS